jgi:hypothetical protein
MPPTPPGRGGLTAHPALAFGKAAATPDDLPDLDITSDVPFADRDDADADTAADTTPAPRPFAAVPSTTDDGDRSFLDRVNDIFEQNHAPAAPTTPVPPPTDADASDAEADDDASDASGGETPPPVLDPPAPVTLPAAPAAPTPNPADGPDYAALTKLDQWMRGLTPTQLAAMQQAIADPTLVLAPRPAAAPAAPVAPEPDPYDPSEWMDERAAAAYRAQQAELAALRAQLTTVAQQQMSTTQAQIAARVTAARDEWAAANSVDAATLARIEALPSTHALLRQFAEGREDYEQVTREVLDHAVWLDPELRAAALQREVAKAVEATTSDLARVRERKARAAQVAPASGSAPRVDSTPVGKLPPQERARLATEFLGERMTQTAG